MMCFVLVFILTITVSGSQALLVPIETQHYTGAMYVNDRGDDFTEKARISAMVFDDHGHSPFNFYEGMANDGGCIRVTVGMTNTVLNVTVACEGTSSMMDGALVCPTWKGNHQWRAAYVSVRRLFNRLTIQGWMPFNETHRIYGNLQVDEQVMTRKQVVYHPNAVEFSHDQECSCHFRNEFVMDLSDTGNVEQSSLGYCLWQFHMQSWVVMYISSVTGLFTIGLSAYLVIRLALWRIKTRHGYGCDMK